MPGGGTFAYDAENRQTSYNNGAATYHYDGNAKRVKKVAGSVTTVFVYDAGGLLVAEYTNDTPQSGGTSYFTDDHLGSNRLVSDANGAVTARHDYLPFGEELCSGTGGRSSDYKCAGDPVRQKFTGKERDAETGLDYFLARYYSAKQGRFTSPDEFTGGPDEFYKFGEQAAINPTFYADLTEPQSLNKYQYAYNNPLLYTDPDGHQSVRERIRQAAQTAVETLNGAASALAEDNGLDLKSSGAQNKVGRAIGHGLAIFQGSAEMLTGGLMVVGGGAEAIATSETVVLAVPGVMTAAAGAAVSTHGASVVSRTARNLFSKKTELSKQKKVRTVEGAVDQEKGLAREQARITEQGGYRISTKKSKQNRKTELKKIKQKSDVEEQ